MLKDPSQIWLKLIYHMDYLVLEDEFFGTLKLFFVSDRSWSYQRICKEKQRRIIWRIKLWTFKQIPQLGVFNSFDWSSGLSIWLFSIVICLDSRNHFWPNLRPVDLSFPSMRRERWGWLISWICLMNVWKKDHEYF